VILYDHRFLEWKRSGVQFAARPFLLPFLSLLKHLSTPRPIQAKLELFRLCFARVTGVSRYRSYLAVQIFNGEVLGVEARDVYSVVSTCCKHDLESLVSD